jgi:large subunit ribosomal protein L20
MSRVKRGFKARRRRKKILALAKGFRGTRKSLFRTAIHVVKKSLAYSYRDRKRKKRDFRMLTITRINAAARSYGMRYSELIHGLKKSKIEMDRTVLANMATSDPASFAQVVAQAKSALA